MSPSIEGAHRGESVEYPSTSGRLLGVPIDVLATPRDGDTYADRWWVVRDGRALFWQRKGGHGWTPQCNHDRRLPERMAATMYAPAEVAFLPVAHLGYFDENWGHRLAWVTPVGRSDPETGALA